MSPIAGAKKTTKWFADQVITVFSRVVKNRFLLPLNSKKILLDRHSFPTVLMPVVPSLPSGDIQLHIQFTSQAVHIHNTE